MTTQGRLERDFGEMYIGEGGHDGDPRRPPVVVRTKRIEFEHGKVPHQRPFKNGLPTFKPVVYANPADLESDEDDDDDSPPPPPPPPPSQPAFSMMSAPTVTYSQPVGGKMQQSAVYYLPPRNPASPSPPLLTSTLNRDVQVEHTYSPGRGSPTFHISYSPPPSPGRQSYPPSADFGAGMRQQHNQHPVRPMSSPDIPDAYDDEEEEFIPPPVPAQVTFGSLSPTHRPRTAATHRIGGPGGFIEVSVETRPRSPFHDVRDMGSVPYRQSPPPQPASIRYGGEPSRLLCTAPARPTTHGFAQSRPMNVAHDHPRAPSPRSSPYDPQFSRTGPEQHGSYSPVPSHGQSSPVLRPPRPYQLHTGVDMSHMPRGPGPLPQDAPIRGHVPMPSDQPIKNPDQSGKEAEVDALTSLLMQSIEASANPDFFGMCARCGSSIMGENTGCKALDQVYHVECFTCTVCDALLRGHPFFAVEGTPYCEGCYLNTLEKCCKCRQPITDRILRATGKPYHPFCFVCVVCGKSLDGIPFTVDAMNQIHCIEDFHKKFAPRCCVCNLPIVPQSGQEETVRIVAMDKSFHIGCYKCEDCGLVLSSEAEGKGCYPLDDHILCKNCNAKRIQAMTTKMTTEL